jgi:hypothetical protein
MERRGAAVSSRSIAFLAGLSLASACGPDGETTPQGQGGAAGSGGHTSSSTAGAGGSDASGSGGSDATGAGGGAGAGGAGGGSCIEQGHVAGERFSLGDGCNFCDCHADGSTACTERTCVATIGGCSYAGQDHAYAEHFPATDGCNECVCAASGLACTRRDCASSEEGAILMESLDTPCGPDPAFTGKSVLDGLPVSDLVAPFPYKKDGPLYPETLPDTTLRFRVVYEGGFVVCRIPNPGQEAFDIEVTAEWITADGSFDEGFHTYLRRGVSQFVDAWYVFASAPAGGLHGTFEPKCLDPNGFGFFTSIDANGTATGDVSKTCETDISLTVGAWSYAP